MPMIVFLVYVISVTTCAYVPGSQRSDCVLFLASSQKFNLF